MCLMKFRNVHDAYYIVICVSFYAPIHMQNDQGCIVFGVCSYVCNLSLVISFWHLLCTYVEELAGNKKIVDLDPLTPHRWLKPQTMLFHKTHLFIHVMQYDQSSKLISSMHVLGIFKSISLVDVYIQMYYHLSVSICTIVQRLFIVFLSLI